jgi:uncharacterized protein YciI
MRYVVLIDYTDLAARERALPAHRAHLAAGRERGMVTDSGPFADGRGGMYVLEAPDDAAAQRFVADDPYQGAGLRLELRCWPKMS